MRYLVSFLMILALSGCATKLAENDSEKMLDFGLSNSKKLEIKESESVSTFVTVTYLNPISHELITQDSEKFIVSTYRASKDNSFERTNLRNFKVNGKEEGVKVSPLSSDSPLLKLVSAASAWSSYVLVEATKTEQIKMEISFENDQSTRVSASFQKD